ncbi:hypothetical protein [Ralstonia syzygii]|uniref:hypothetical protein n=1 Tax=Ralstonia syzygii TaxID=28097 RepID=UPI0018D035F3|nr:hypothetical protein [Ralstonia syzygii]
MMGVLRLARNTTLAALNVSRNQMGVAGAPGSRRRATAGHGTGEAERNVRTARFVSTCLISRGPQRPDITDFQTDVSAESGFIGRKNLEGIPTGHFFPCRATSPIDSMAS